MAKIMEWDVPVKDDCPVCGHTMFKKSGRGYKRPFCINADCSNLLPEDKRGYPKKAAAEETGEAAEGQEEKPVKKTATKKADTKSKKAAEKKTTTKKPAAKKKAADTEEN